MINQSSRLKLTDPNSSSWSQSNVYTPAHAAKKELLVNAANSRLQKNETTGPSAINLLSESDMTGFALANAIDGNNTAGGTTGDGPT